MIANEEVLADKSLDPIEVTESKKDDEDGESGGKHCILIAGGRRGCIGYVGKYFLSVL